MDQFELVIVGGGLTAARAIKSYRDAGGSGTIALLAQERTLPYHRPPLSKAFMRGESDADALAEQEGFYREHGVEVLLGTTVTAVSPRERSVNTGTRLCRYQKLLLAPGSRPRRLEVPGSDLAGVFSLRTRDDARAIRAAAGEGRDAVVVGGGFIGLEVASSLRQRGVETALLHRATGLFQLLDAPELERELAALVRAKGVELILGDEVAEFGGSGGHVDSVVTKTGRILPTDLVVVGVGVDPVVDFLAGSGIELANGIVVDERFETNIPGIFAAGDRPSPAWMRRTPPFRAFSPRRSGSRSRCWAITRAVTSSSRAARCEKETCSASTSTPIAWSPPCSSGRATRPRPG